MRSLYDLRIKAELLRSAKGVRVVAGTGSYICELVAPLAHSNFESTFLIRDSCSSAQSKYTWSTSQDLTIHKLFSARADLHRTVYTHAKAEGVSTSLMSFAHRNVGLLSELFQHMVVDALLEANDHLVIDSSVDDPAKYLKNMQSFCCNKKNYEGLPFNFCGGYIAFNRHISSSLEHHSGLQASATKVVKENELLSALAASPFKAGFASRKSRDEYLEDVEKCPTNIKDGQSYESCLTTQLRKKSSNLDTIELKIFGMVLILLWLRGHSSFDSRFLLAMRDVHESKLFSLL
ncbi:hypothetical protein Dimus_011712 [Dionaea muscipula]